VNSVATITSRFRRLGDQNPSAGLVDNIPRDLISRRHGRLGTSGLEEIAQWYSAG